MEYRVQFQPFQLYPELPRLNDEGVDRAEFFERLGASRGMDRDTRQGRFRRLQGAWKDDGLELADRGGRLGNSVDAQRLISFARKQDREDAMIEAIYTANHVKNLCLSSREVLLGCAEQAGVVGAAEMLDSRQELAEVVSKIMLYQEMGITAVPVLIINDRYPIHGAPEPAYLQRVFAELLDKGDDMPWPLPEERVPAAL